MISTVLHKLCGNILLLKLLQDLYLLCSDSG